MENKKISVIIPVYNVEKYLSRCLDSIINQTYKNLEIICIDDGSTDTSAQILKEYAQKDSRIKIITQQNSGQGTARNKGIDAALGEYILFVDSDDSLPLSACQKLLDKITYHDADFLFFDANIYDTIHNFVVTNKDFMKIYELEDKVNQNTVFSYKDIKDYIFHNFFPWNKIYRATFLKSKNIKFDEELTIEDIIFHIKCFLLADKISYSTDCLYNYTMFHPTSVTERFKNNIECLDIIPVAVSVEKFLRSNGLYAEVEKQFLKWKINTFLNYYSNIKRNKSLRILFRKKIQNEFKKLIKQYDKDYVCKLITEDLKPSYDKVMTNRLIYYIKSKINII